MVLDTAGRSTTRAAGEREDAPVGVRDESSPRSLSQSGRARIRVGASLARGLTPISHPVEEGAPARATSDSPTAHTRS